MLLTQSEISVIKIIRDSTVISRSEIARAANLTKPTVSRIVENLISRSVVKPIAVGKSTKKGGRKPILLSFNPSYRYVVCLDIGGTKLRAALTNLEGEIVHSIDEFTGNIDSQTSLIKKIVETTKRLYRREHKILGIGIGIPGTVDSATGFVYYIPSFDLRDINLAQVVSRELDYPVFVGNDVNLSALGEFWKGAAKGFKHALLVSLGTGTGAGLIINGQLYEGKKGMAGEIGYLVTDWSIERNLDFRFGPLEYWFSGYSFKHKLTELGRNITVKELFETGLNDQELSKILVQGLEHLAIAIANAICLLDLDAVVISGGIGANQYEKIMKVIMPVINRLVPKEILENVVFKCTKLGDLGAILGACYWVQKEMFVI